jgi:pyridoxamine 5'-phosphate oxidase family protein
MSVFTVNELHYLRQQHLGRLATIDAHGDPRVVPVGFRYNPETDTIDIGGYNFAQTQKWRNAMRHPRVAFVIDDVLPPWQARAIEIQAEAELLENGGEQFPPGFAPEIMRLHPVKVTTWGIDGERRGRLARVTETLAI